MSSPTDGNDGESNFQAFLRIRRLRGLSEWPFDELLQTPPPDQKPQENLHVTIGNDLTSNQPITIGDIERRSGLYVLGKPRMGKSTLLVNMMFQDIKNGHGVFFLDPHGEAIDDLLRLGIPHPDYRVILYDPTDKKYSWGMNPLQCDDVSDGEERTIAYNKTYSVFQKLFETEWGPWLQRTISNTIYVFIENQGYTIADMPLFLIVPARLSPLFEKAPYSRMRASPPKSFGFPRIAQSFPDAVLGFG